jgi:hypothetical protein
VGYNKSSAVHIPIPKERLGNNSVTGVGRSLLRQGWRFGCYWWWFYDWRRGDTGRWFPVVIGGGEVIVTGGFAINVLGVLMLMEAEGRIGAREAVDTLIGR